MAGLSAGNLRHSITIRRNAQVSNGRGGYVSQWTDVATVWAEVATLDGRESMVEKVLQGVSSYRIRIRWRDDVKAADQLRYGTLDLNIVAPPADPDGRREELVILASTESVAH